MTAADTCEAFAQLMLKMGVTDVWRTDDGQWIVSRESCNPRVGDERCAATLAEAMGVVEP